MKKGKVYLVGAGPGDIGLLTIKGLRYLQRADVVVYDYHVNGRVLNYVSRGAEFIYAGKRGGHHAMSQDEINSALVEKAREGKVVCRLKGGDPFVFGRGGEEAEVLSREGIEFEVIPGVTSVVAAPACAGIPLTHRDYSSSFAVVTGNEAVTKGGGPVSWPSLAAGYQTLVFLMGVKNVGIISERLMEAGKGCRYAGSRRPLGNKAGSGDHSCYSRDHSRGSRAKRTPSSGGHGGGRCGEAEGPPRVV